MDEIEATNRGRRLGAGGPLADPLRSTFEAISCDRAGPYPTAAAERQAWELEDAEAAAYRERHQGPEIGM